MSSSDDDASRPSKRRKVDGVPEGKDYTDQAFYEPTGFGELGLGAQYLRNKRKKLAVQREQFIEDAGEEETSLIFKNVSVYINGLTTTPLATLSRLLTLHGGEYVPYLDKKSLVSHIIAANLTPSKKKEFASYKVVTEQWVLDSVAAGKLLDWRLYRLDGAAAQPRMTMQSQVPMEATGGLPTAQQSLLGHISPGKSTQAAIKSTKKERKVEMAPSSEWEAYLPAAKNKRRDNLLNDEKWRLENTAVAGKSFIEGYNSSSRLHHLSTWKAQLPQMVERMKKELEEAGKVVRAKTTAIKPAKPLKGTIEDGRTIFHVDFDSFFCSVGLASRPHLRGKPVAVCHAKGAGDDGTSSTSEIASCSYEARAKGVKNGISLGRARELCPDIVAMAYEFDLYADKSESLYKILLMHGDALEAVSVDEAYIDVSTQLDTPEAALALAESIRTEIREATECEASIGISHNIVLSRLATRRAKPASAYVLRDHEVAAFLAPLPVDELPSVGYTMKAKLEEACGIKTLADALRIGKSRMQETVGQKNGEMIYNYARGIDTRTLQPPKIRKSISVEINWGIRFHNDGEVEQFMKDMADELAKRMRQCGTRGRHLTLKVMRRAATAPVETPKFMGHGVCDTVTRIADMNVSTDDPAVMGVQAVKLMQGLAVPATELRGIALQIQQLDTAGDTSQKRLTFGKTIETPAPAVASTSKTVIHSSQEAYAPPPGETAIVVPRQYETRSRSRTPSVQAPLFLKQSKKPGTTGKSVQTKFKTDGRLKDPRRRLDTHIPLHPTDAQFDALGISRDYWDGIAFSRQLQMDTWQNAQIQLETAQEAAAAAGGVLLRARSATPTIEDAPMLTRKFVAPVLPRFGGKSDLDGVRDRLEAWVDVAASDGPSTKDVGKLKAFLVARSDRQTSAGADLALVAGVMAWWRALIDGMVVHEDWRTAFDEVRVAVDGRTGLAPMSF